MPLTRLEAKDKRKVFDELKKNYRGGASGSGAPPRKWEENNFTFKPPTDQWLTGIRAQGAIEVELKTIDEKTFSVDLIGRPVTGPHDGPRTERLNVGVIKYYEHGKVTPKFST